MEGMVTVRVDSELSINEAQLDRVAYARLVRKGGGGRDRVRGIHAGYFLRSGLWRDSGPCQGAFAAYEIVTRGVSLAARASACRGGFENQTLSSTADDFNLQVEGAHVWDFSIVSLHVSLGLGPSWLYQTFATTGVAPTMQTVAATLTAGAGLELPMPRGLVLDAGVAAGGYGFRDRVSAHEARWTTTVTLVARLGLGLRW